MNRCDREAARPTRRVALKTGAAMLGGAAVAWGLPGTAHAADYPALGTFPAGSSGDSVFVGIAVPRTGTYAVQGEDLLKGYELAIEHLNAGDELIRKISPKTTKGVLGKTVKHGVADNEAKPNTAVQAHSRFISENKAVMIAGCCIQRGGCGAEQAGRSREGHLSRRHQRLERHDGQGLRPLRFPHLLLRADRCRGAGAGSDQEHRRDNKKIAFLTPDYTYGHTVRQAMEEFLQEGRLDGCDQPGLPARHAGLQLLPAEHRQFSGADVFININFGNDAVQSIKQAQQFGILQKQTLVVAYSVPFLSKRSRAGDHGGRLHPVRFLVDDPGPVSRWPRCSWSAFVAKYNYKPEWGAERRLHAGGALGGRGRARQARSIRPR